MGRACFFTFPLVNARDERRLQPDPNELVEAAAQQRDEPLDKGAEWPAVARRALDTEPGPIHTAFQARGLCVKNEYTPPRCASLLRN